MPPELLPPSRAPGAPAPSAPRTRWALALLSVCVLASASCSVLMPPEPTPAPAPVEPPPPPPPAPPPAPEVDPADAAARRFLAYHEQMRQMSAAELGQELSRLNAHVAATASAASPAVVLELAAVLAQARSLGVNGADLGRAIALLDPLIRSSAPELKPWQPLARLLQMRYIEQRKAEDAAERQAAQLREAQRNVQQLNEKLEALKAIERSLNARPAGVGVPPPATPTKP